MLDFLHNRLFDKEISRITYIHYNVSNDNSYYRFLYQTIALKLPRIYKTLKYHITSQEYSLLTFCSFNRLQSMNSDRKLIILVN